VWHGRVGRGLWVARVPHPKCRRAGIAVGD
jgi:hypothetical protein